MNNSSTLRYLFPHQETSKTAQGQVIWLYGLSGAGKSTIAHAAKNKLLSSNKKCFVLDGDDLRTGLNSDLGFSDHDRQENLRRAGEVARLLSYTTDIVICTFITPFNDIRGVIHGIMQGQSYKEVFIDTPLSECERRDVKGLYKKARQGLIKDFTGIDSPFEKPISPDLVISTREKSIDMCADELLKLI
ncbi:MAG: adenylyl-sulfate kinase [Gammaproteobacteria bacterium]|nr:adenylyl-sulfate kinase [Gammaproteobacteria bacterium]